MISIRRLTIRIAVVLPQPDGPTSTQISPAGTSSERSSTAGCLGARVALGDVTELERRGVRSRRRAVLGPDLGVVSVDKRSPVGEGRRL